MPFETVTPVLPAGAGRILDYTWPDPWIHDGGPVTQVRTRNGQNEGSQGGPVSFGYNGGNSLSWSTIQGVDVLGLNCSALGANVGLGFQLVGMLHIGTTKGPPLSSLYDDFRAKRFITICAAQAQGNAGLDFGVQFTRMGASNSTILIDAVDGWGIQLVDANTAAFIVRGPNGFFQQNFAVQTQTLNAYEFLILDATATTEAQLQLKINGNVMPLAAASSNWGPGSNLPPAAINGGLPGFQSKLLCRAGNLNRLNVYKHRMITAPSLLMCN